MIRRCFAVAAVVAGLLLPSVAAAQEFKDHPLAAKDAEATFGMKPKATVPHKVTLIEQSAPGNVYHEGEQPRLVFQVENTGKQVISGDARIRVMRYGQHGTDSLWQPRVAKLEELPGIPLDLNLAPGAWTSIVVEPQIPETKGGYALLFDLGPHGQAWGTSLVRTFKPQPQRVQYGKQALDALRPDIMSRLGFNAVGRLGIKYHVKGTEGRDTYMRELDALMKDYHAHGITVMGEIGVGGLKGDHQPLGRGRPHLDSDGVMRDTKQDYVWLPGHDDDYEQWVYDVVSTYGWPKGPITAIDLWNEPWEGISISGWGADMPRYRELYKRAGDAVFRARKTAGVEVLIGGCDSGSNTWDKLFGEGLENSPFWPEYLDFCGIHYQGMSIPALHPEWVNRKHYNGRVLIWDTESWVANADDRYAGVVAANRAAGYDRALGTRWSYAISRTDGEQTVRTGAGSTKMAQVPEARPLAAAYGAVQHFIGERDFREMLLHQSVPYVFVFNGLDGKADDGTIVVLGDLASLFNKGSGKPSLLLSRVKPLDPNKTPVLRIPADKAPFALYDFYGNRVNRDGGDIVVPLDSRGFFLRADPAIPGSFAALVDVVRGAEVQGFEPVEIAAVDMIRPVEQKPTLRLRLTSQQPVPVVGQLTVSLGNLKLGYERSITLAPRERKWVDLAILEGKPDPSNRYPLRVSFDAGQHGRTEHDEEMRVNWISRKSITVDGGLEDWAGAVPQVIDARGEKAQRSLEEETWLPFQKYDETQTEAGLAVGYVAYDDEYFYFAAKIADTTVASNGIRFETRKDDDFFYPEVAYEKGKGDKRIEHKWPEGVRRFSYRKQPDMPSGWGDVKYDNVLLGFNPIPVGEDGWLANLPGRPPKLIVYKTTDYEYALNKVSEKHGGGTEVWRLETPDMPRKHFFPRQPKHPKDGPVKEAKLVVTHDGSTRLVEAAIPWAEIPHVRQLMERGQPLKFSFRVNHDNSAPDMQLSMKRSIAEGLSRSFHPDWTTNWPNELEFGWER